jgi:hypothetical protein
VKVATPTRQIGRARLYLRQSLASRREHRILVSVPTTHDNK